MPRYQIIDEPSPQGLAHLAVRPFWPLLALMFAGPWLSWPWFVLNAVAIGSAGRGRQVAWACGGFAGAVALTVAILLGYGLGWYGRGAIPYLLAGVTVWKVLVSYSLYLSQAPSAELHEYAGGPLRNGLFALLAGALFGRRFLVQGIESLGPGALKNLLSAGLL